MAKVKVEFPKKAWTFVPTVKAREIITDLREITKRSKTSLINEACEKMEKG